MDEPTDGWADADDVGRYGDAVTHTPPPILHSRFASGRCAVSLTHTIAEMRNTLVPLKIRLPMQ